MKQNLLEYSLQHKPAVYLFLKQCVEAHRAFLLKSDLVDILENCKEKDGGAALKTSVFEQAIYHAEEAAVQEGWVYLSVRWDVAHWAYWRFQVDQILCQEVSPTDFLVFKESIVETKQPDDAWDLELDVSPFKRNLPMLRQTRSIGHGVEFMNRHLARTMTDAKMEGLLEFLKVHQYRDVQLLLNDRVKDLDMLQQALRDARNVIKKIDPATEWSDFAGQLPNNCFEAGWGRTAAGVVEMMTLLLDLMESPSNSLLEEFLSRIPMISKLAVLSPHGYFGQSNVLGLPDTGGQVVYILDQVRALEKQMCEDLYRQGLDVDPKIIIVTRLIPDAGDTTCNQRIEPILGTNHTYILRVPFRYENGEVVSHWISRFEIWPFLERYARDVQIELLGELGGKPDLIIGNYSDGNLVATLLSRQLNVTQCTIAHALEKTKYLYSALHWKEHEEQYHFACQFTADLLAMNHADFIITSTYQEIAGTDESVGQYESYMSFTMPGLYRVLNGVNIYDPKFNIVSPGADEEVYFPYFEHDRRLVNLHDDIHEVLYGPPHEGARGQLTDAEKPLLFVMSRMDSIKNVAGVVQWYAENEALQDAACLFLVSGKVDPATSSDAEEQAQARLIHQLMDEHGLDDKVRWVNSMSDRNFNGEMYRVVADKKGAFIQPALFEAFGLTVIEAMSSGLPVFATCYGGPLEIIENGVSGFHIDPNRGQEAAEMMVSFYEACRQDSTHWDTISRGALKRVEEAYTWRLYANRLLTLSRIYGFWKHMSNVESEPVGRYLQMFYSLMYRRLAQSVPEK